MDEDELNNPKSRDFICACGKNYLSYAALFTHIKQKHDGKVSNMGFRRLDPSSGHGHRGREVGRGRIPSINPNSAIQVVIALYTESDNPNNGISSGKDINNNIHSSDRKTKNAAEQLGCGKFQAFQTYKEDSSLFRSMIGDRDPAKKTQLKKAISTQEKDRQGSPKHEVSSEKSV